MFTNLKEWHYPESVEEALSLMKKGEAVPYAGGTGLLRARKKSIRAMIDMKKLPLHEFAVGNSEITIGANVTFTEIAGNTSLEGPLSILKQAAGQAASTPLRNLITVGGSIAVPMPWSDLSPVLLALDAVIMVEGSAGGHYSAEEYLKKLPLDGTSLITGIKIPKRNGKAHFVRNTQTTFDYSMLDLAVCTDIDAGTFKSIRVAVGCAVPRAVRLKAVEDYLKDKKTEAGVIEEAIALALIKPMVDRRTSKEYRQHLLGVLLKRSLLTLISGKNSENKS